jgi:hypothetical protein
MAQNIANKFFTSSMYELNVGHEHMEVIKGKLKGNKMIEDPLFDLLSMEVKNNLKDSFKKFIKTEIFQVEFLKNRQRSFLRKKLNDKPTSSPELTPKSKTVEDYESQHLRKLQVMAEKIQTKTVTTRKQKTKSSRLDSSRKMSAEPNSDTDMNQYNLQSYSFGEADHSNFGSISFIMPGEKTSREMKGIKEEDKRRRKSSVQMFFGDLLKKFSTKKEKQKSPTLSVRFAESESDSDEFEENIYKL